MNRAPDNVGNFVHFFLEDSYKTMGVFLFIFMRFLPLPTQKSAFHSVLLEKVYIFHRGFRKNFCLSICVNGIKKGRFQPYSVLKPSEEIVMNVKLRKKFPEHRPMFREFF